MAKKDQCVFCGKELSAFSSSLIGCGRTTQIACRDCVKTLMEVSELERCRLALDSGRAIDTERMQAFLDEHERKEQARPICLRCGVRMRVEKQINLDISPISDGLLSRYLPVLPVYCDQCGKIEFFDPNIMRSRWEEKKTTEKKDSEDEERSEW